MRRVILIISGFTQDNHEETGSNELYRKLLPFSNYESHDDITFVRLKPWDSDWKSFALWLNAIGTTDVLVCAYSWGAGYGLKRFAKYFDGSVRAVLCDPVYRSTTPWMRWLAITRKLFIPTIKYPKNVIVRRWFTQYENQPGGDNVSAVDMPVEPDVLPFKHTDMDSSLAYHNAALEEANLYLLNA